MPYHLSLPVGAIIDFLAWDVPAGFLELVVNSTGNRAAHAALFAAMSKVLNGTLTNTSAVVTNLAETYRLFVGMAVEGTGITAGTTIASIDSGTQITLSAAATASGVKSLTFFLAGAGNGTTTFGLPDMSGQVGIGFKVGDVNRVMGQTVGAEVHELTAAECPALAMASDGTSGSDGVGTASYSSPGNGHSNMQPSLVVRKAIKF
jgi:hypothetical protein